MRRPPFNCDAKPSLAPAAGTAVDHYHVWVDLRQGVKDMDFATSITAMMQHMQRASTIEGHTLTRRKLGFGPETLGEWHIDILVKDMAQLEAAFDQVTPRTGEMEKLHAAVWSKVTNFKSGLWRDFPDANRI